MTEERLVAIEAAFSVAEGPALKAVVSDLIAEIRRLQAENERIVRLMANQAQMTAAVRAKI